MVKCFIIGRSETPFEVETHRDRLPGEFLKLELGANWNLEIIPELEPHGEQRQVVGDEGSSQSIDEPK